MSSEGRFIPYETIDYVMTINSAVSDVRKRRADINTSNKVVFERSIDRYFWAVDALYVTLIPRLRTSKMRRLREEAHKIRTNGSSKDLIKLLDALFEEILNMLDRAGLLIRGEKIVVEE